MLTASIKTTRTKILGTACVVLAAVIAVILFFAGESGKNAAESISLRVTNNEERTGYIASKGFKTAEEPSLVEEILLPEEFDEILSEYNEIQKESGFDLSPYLGKKVKKYVYPIEGKEEVFATLYVYENKVIAADIASHTEDWQRPIDGAGNMG
ncbi:MAG: DUF4830 domain-containing protein [Ruminococcaceae bacterium]|nr:DUF4830 domain-containing protein [Oscillospiraceae bacterium]